MLLSIHGSAAFAQELGNDGLNSFPLRVTSLPAEQLWYLAGVAAGDSAEQGGPSTIHVSRQSLQQRRPGDFITVPLGHAHYLFEVVNREVQNGGGISLTALMRETAENYFLSLTFSDDLLLATVFSPVGKYTAVAKANADFYSGPLQVRLAAASNLLNGSEESPQLPVYYEHPRDLLKLYTQSQSQHYSTNSNFTITQQGNREFTLEGQTITVNVTVRNNTSEARTNLRVIFDTLLDTANYVNSTIPCAPEEIEDETKIVCLLPSVPASGQELFNIGFQATGASFPQLRNTIEIEESSQTTYFDVSRDIFRDSDVDGLGDIHEGLMGTDPLDDGSLFDSSQTLEIDLLVYYTPHFLNSIGHNQPVTEINQQLAVANSLFSQSDARVRFRAVLTQLVDYQLGEDLFLAYDDLRRGLSAFAEKNLLQKLSGADAVLLLDGNTHLTSSGTCGVADLAGSGSFGDLGHFSAQFHNHIVASYPGGRNVASGRSCSDDLLAHELGHILGLGHAQGDTGSIGTFPWAQGYGVNSKFKTIMASNQSFGLLASAPFFSNPRIFQCNGLACGVDRSDIDNGADAAFALNLTRFHVANYEQPIPTLSVATLAGDTTTATLLGGAIQSANPNVSTATFSDSLPADKPFSVMGIVNVAGNDIGQAGKFHVVIAVADIGLFHINEVGDYLEWDGQLDTLAAYRSVDSLPEQQELFAFRDFVAEDVGVEEAQLTVYFAYSVNNSNTFVFSDAGVNFSLTDSED